MEKVDIEMSDFEQDVYKQTDSHSDLEKSPVNNVSQASSQFDGSMGNVKSDTERSCSFTSKVDKNAEKVSIYLFVYLLILSTLVLGTLVYTGSLDTYVSNMASTGSTKKKLHAGGESTGLNAQTYSGMHPWWVSLGTPSNSGIVLVSAGLWTGMVRLWAFIGPLTGKSAIAKSYVVVGIVAIAISHAVSATILVAATLYSTFESAQNSHLKI